MKEDLNDKTRQLFYNNFLLFDNSLMTTINSVLVYMWYL